MESEDTTKVPPYIDACEKEVPLQSSVIILNGVFSKEQETPIRMKRARNAIRLVKKLPLQLMGVSTVLLIVWGLLSLPIIYFHTEIQLHESNNTNPNMNGSLNESFIRLASSNSSRNECTIACEEDFFCLEDGGLCVPTCPSWSDYPPGTANTIDALVIVFACVGLVSALGVMVISCVRRKHIFTFPSVFVFYETITITVLMVLFLMNYMDRGHLYCSSDNLLVNIYETSTPFCTLSGSVLYYCMLQLNLWWVFHVSILFWKLQFPLRAIRFTHYMWRVHLTCVLVGIFAPLLPVVVAIAHSQTEASFSPYLPRSLGFGLATFPPILCYMLDKNVVFYSFILPLTLLMLIGITTLILTIVAVHKQQGLFQKKSSSAKTSSQSGTAEKKLLLVFLYFFLLTVVSYTGFSIFHRKIERYNFELMTYFTCEQNGHDPTYPCDRTRFESLSYPAATAVAYILVELSPLVNFVFVINIQDLKAAIKSLTSQK